LTNLYCDNHLPANKYISWYLFM